MLVIKILKHYSYPAIIISFSISSRNKHNNENVNVIQNHKTFLNSNNSINIAFSQTSLFIQIFGFLLKCFPSK